MSDSADRVLEVARVAGRRAAAVCRAVLAESADAPGAMAKGDNSPVTVADYGSQAVILDAVRAAFPAHGIIAEEGSAHLRMSAGEAGVVQIVRLVGQSLGRALDFSAVCGMIDHSGGGVNAEFAWCVDPIDGTKGFLRREQYAVAIGVLRAGRPWAGVLACPNLPVDFARPDGPRGLMFVAAQGRGCTVEALDAGAARPTRVTRFADPRQWRVLGSVESAHGDPQLLHDVIARAGVGGGFVRYDSQVKYGVVAMGAAEIYLRPRNKPAYREQVWDHAAGVIVCEEAGGCVSDMDGKLLDFSRGKRLEDNRGVLATSGGAVHEAMLRALAALSQ